MAGFDRGVRPIGAWSTSTTLSMNSTPVMVWCNPGRLLARWTCLANDRRRMSFTRVDLPDPETPVTATNCPRGNETVMSLRLCSPAPWTTSWSPLLGRRNCGTGIDFAPDRYKPVNDSAFCKIPSGPSTGPECTMRPPCSPAPGPTSTTWSAILMVSSSCSTTMTVLPRSRSRSSVPISRWLSRWCSPMEGSSSTYNTPTRPDPIWLARRMRCASPPERVAAERARVR